MGITSLTTEMLGKLVPEKYLLFILLAKNIWGRLKFERNVKLLK